MDYVVVEGLPALGKSEVIELLARFYPDRVRVFPELVKEIVLRDDLDLFGDRDALTTAIADALPDRAARIASARERGFLCIEESHLCVHRAYAESLGDRGFLDAYDDLDRILPRPDAYVRLQAPLDVSIARQAGRGTPGFEIDRPTLERTWAEVDRWHEIHATKLLRVDVDRPANLVVADLERLLDLSYGVSPEILRETFDILLVLGRPASGKSELIDFLVSSPIEARARTYHIAPFDVVDDFPILWEKFEEDDVWERLGRGRLHSKRCDENYAVGHDDLWHFLIERINGRVTPRLADASVFDVRTLLIEFSRGGPTGYADALARLAPEILRQAAILYVSVSFDESWRRNIARYDEKLRDGILTHSVPREEMERTYGKDDWPTLAGAPHGTLAVQGVEVPYATMGNEPESTDPEVLSARYREALEPLYRRWRAGRSPR